MTPQQVLYSHYSAHIICSQFEMEAGLMNHERIIFAK